LNGCRTWWSSSQDRHATSSVVAVAGCHSEAIPVAGSETSSARVRSVPVTVGTPVTIAPPPSTTRQMSRRASRPVTGWSR
jgi:hypothetical protein